jgi:hypothetical protein
LFNRHTRVDPSGECSLLFVNRCRRTSCVPPRKGDMTFEKDRRGISQSRADDLNAKDIPAGVDMTCDPVAGFVQLPCIERCGFGAVKAWTGFVIATNEIPAHRRVDFDTTVAAMALTAKEMNAKYKKTSEGGLAVSVTLC